MAKKKRKGYVSGGEVGQPPSGPYDATKWASRDAASSIINDHPDVRDLKDSLGDAIHRTVKRHLYLGRPLIKKGNKRR